MQNIFKIFCVAVVATMLLFFVNDVNKVDFGARIIAPPSAVVNKKFMNWSIGTGTVSRQEDSFAMRGSFYVKASLVV